MPPSPTPPFLRSLTAEEKTIVVPAILLLPGWLAEELADQIEFYRDSIGEVLLVRNLLDTAKWLARENRDYPYDPASREQAARTLDAVARRFEEDFGAGDDQ